jgi:hypothetical protein
MGWNRLTPRAAQMARTMHFALGPDRLHRAFGALESSLKSAGGRPDCRLLVANALWGQRGEGFLPEFLELTNKNYGAGVRENVGEAVFRAPTERDPRYQPAKSSDFSANQPFRLAVEWPVCAK